MMEDTPAHVKKLQLEIWLSKTPEERLTLALKMNDELDAFWNEGRKNMAARKKQNGAPIADQSREVPK